MNLIIILGTAIWVFLSLLCGIPHTAEANVISKVEWNGAEATSELTKLELPLSRVIISHTAGAECDTVESCSQQMLNIQDYQMKTLHFDDIAYNFLIGNDGNVYEGRGWEFQGAVARGYNAGTLSLAFFGNYADHLPNESSLEAAKNLLALGVNDGKLDPDYKLFGHRQLKATTSPGNALYAALKQWPHWSRSI